MTSLSDRQHDAFDNPAKMACREGNLRVLREAGVIDKDHQIRLLFPLQILHEFA